MQILDSDVCDNWINLITDRYKFIVFLSVLSFTILDTELKKALKVSSSIADPKHNSCILERIINRKAILLTEESGKKQYEIKSFNNNTPLVTQSTFVQGMHSA